MKRAVLAFCIAAVMAVLAGTLLQRVQSAAQAAPNPTLDDPPAAGPFDSTMLWIAQSYAKQFTRIDDNFRVAPQLCAAPTVRPLTSDYTFSRSKDEQSHGQKLFVLYASDAAGYRDLSRADKGAKPGQMIVKQSWTAVPMKEGEKLPHGLPTIKDGKSYRPGEQRELFLMARFAPDTAGTDEGWVYGVVSSDGKNVIRAGRLENCMSCHTDAPHGRLFGLSDAGPATRPAQK